MVKSLHISNYAIIDRIELDFHPGLTIITGETGAGKSILLGALGLILGNRADTSVLYKNDEKCIVEAVFDIRDYHLKSLFNQEDLDYDDTCLIRREINAQGKSRAFINDTPTTLSTLRRLSEELIDLHQQFDTLEINEENFQAAVLDALTDKPKLINEYKNTYKDYRSTTQQLKKLQQENKQAAQDLDFITFQLEELSTLNLQAGELVGLEQELRLMQGSEDLKVLGNTVTNTLEESEMSVSNAILELMKMSEKLTEIDPDCMDIYQRLSSIREEIYDLSKVATSLAERAEYDPARMDEVEERMDEINRLLNKHRLTEDHELIGLRNNLEVQLETSHNLDEEIKTLENDLQTLHKSLTETGNKITEHRKKAGARLSTEVARILHEMSMPHSKLEVSIQPADNFKETGADNIAFLFAANKGSVPQPLQKVASGGELSRLNLAIKSIVANAMTLPTLIFDEIDSGVSGSVALKMGNILKKLSINHQTVVITHSPQVASRADHHYFIYKSDAGYRTTTHMKSLSQDERIMEIAKMLSTDPPSVEALQNATQLLTE